MNNQHTSEPWHLAAQNDALYIVDRLPEASNDSPNHDVETRVIARLFGEHETALGNGKRLVLCVQSCIGIPTEKLEEVLNSGQTLDQIIGGGVAAFNEQALLVEDLYQTLKEAKNTLSGCILPSFGYKTVEAITALINKVEARGNEPIQPH